MHKLFFALYPTPEAALAALDRARETARVHGLLGRLVAPERLHVSLNFLGADSRRPTQLIDGALAAASKVSMRPFTVVLDRVVSFSPKAERKPLVLYGEDGVLGALALHAAIHARLAEAGLAARPEPEINPHMTLLRDAKAVPETFVAPVGWTAAEFVLILSLQGAARHEVLGRWQLA